MEKYKKKRFIPSVKQKRFIVAMTALLSQIIILLILIAANGLVFATNDDTTMVAIVGGGYGAPSEYLVNMHLLLGYLLKFLFTNLPGINWLTIFFLSVYFWSFFTLDFIYLVNPKISNSRKYMRLVLIDLCWLLVIRYFTFTVVAYIAGIAGILNLYESIIARKKILCIGNLNALGLLIIGSLVRGEIFQSLLVVFVLVIAVDIIKYKRFKAIAIVFFSLTLMVLSIQSNFFLCNQNPQQKQFLEWGETRSAALDCQAVPYEPVSFTDAGISQFQYQALYNAFYYTYDAVSLDVCENLIELNAPTNRYNFDAIDFIQQHFAYTDNLLSFNTFFQVLFTIVLLFYALFGEKRIYCVPIYLGVIATEFLFFFIRRNIYRVVMPNYIFGILLLMLLCGLDGKILLWFKNNKINAKKLSIIATSVLFVFGVYSTVYHYPMYNKINYSFERKKIIEYMEKNEDTLFLAGNADVFSIDCSRSVFEYAGKNALWNLIGNWETYSVPYNILMENYPVDDIYNVAFEAINNEKVLLLTNLGDSFPEYSEYILSLIEQYYGVRPYFVKVEDIQSIRYTDEYVQEWATYQLVLKD